MSKSEPEPVAEVELDGGWRFRLHGDWTWRRAPGPDPPGDWGGYPDMLLRHLRQMGPAGDPLKSLHGTARRGAGLTGGRVVRWWGGWDDPDKAFREATARHRGVF